MDIILREDIKGLGYKNDTVKVKAGYGRNYLIPKGVAILASKSNRKMIDENIRQAAHKAEKSYKDAQAIADRIGEMILEIKTKAGESGKIFGAITAIQAAEALSTKALILIERK
jgi:large subunit ribosomal protein L9